MLNHEILISIKNKARHGLLAFTLLLSFFAISGYINNNRSATRPVNSETLAVREPAGRRGISYKRASLAFCGRTAVHYLTVKESTANRISVYNKVVAIKYLHVKYLSLVHKSITNFQFIRLLYPVDQEYPAIA
ncbi:hypothetical protein [Mucilaginibacter ginsenosidivorax]|uniref:Uncharacterized protein n=1 Tax=Mucilaginibacter ginsenosidivorax TaxID=862126 RepID=A0A5B8W789_9SPHI|nr:hypothetical protein [Mucilaginibacter ginsenosidivorax]QEC79613.1 hypothetical protein FSB76_28020 [Mucilaginibacter ginsenosidivorax]